MMRCVCDGCNSFWNPISLDCGWPGCAKINVMHAVRLPIYLHVVVAWGVVEGVVQAKMVRGETLKPRALQWQPRGQHRILQGFCSRTGNAGLGAMWPPSWRPV